MGLIEWMATALLAAALALPVRADRLELSGRMTDDTGRPMPGETFRLVLGSDPDPRAPDAGRQLTTDAEGRFALSADVALRDRRVRAGFPLPLSRPSRLLEIGLEFDLLGRPALYWVEVDFLDTDAMLGLSAAVAGPDGRFDLPLAFHGRDMAWSIPGDPRNLRLTGLGADVAVDSYEAAAGGIWRLSVAVRRDRFEMR